MWAKRPRIRGFLPHPDNMFISNQQSYEVFFFVLTTCFLLTNKTWPRPPNTWKVGKPPKKNPGLRGLGSKVSFFRPHNMLTSNQQSMPESSEILKTWKIPKTKPGPRGLGFEVSLPTSPHVHYNKKKTWPKPPHTWKVVKGKNYLVSDERWVASGEW